MRRSRRTESQPIRRTVRFAAGGLLLLLCLAFSASAAAAAGNTSVGIRITSWPVGPSQAHVTAVTDSEMPAEVAATVSTSRPIAASTPAGTKKAAAASATPSMISADRLPGESDERALVLVSWE
ncbi:MAG TPA: hypothetical protein PLP50_09260 [Thermoanaerobaculia bacterium]|jgi:hypothetical protein|nr:hypothetical protein [Thermoanaerobaculia bacterium]HPA51779.1 hypothetical protein [Thermoanaerobaculia bacterium]HQN07050.1 hypothetical protein [Thermoanaerobaculia bacterium]HQP87008.1 hypothetical protein [Thermoanaerobaculia bacterium]